MKTLFKLLSILTILLSFSCKTEISSSKFVSVVDQKFYLNGEPFFPYMLNYSTMLRDVQGEIMFAPTREYDDYHIFDSKTPDAVKSRLNAHFKLISEMGFNALRIGGANILDYKRLYPDLGYPLYHPDEKAKTFNISRHPEKILDALEVVVNAAEKNNLKIMLLLPNPQKQSHYNHLRLEYIKSILKRFSSNTTIFAYDFFNEPLYFDNYDYDNFIDQNTRKEEANKKTRFWKKYMNKYAPNQLLTLGLSEPTEVAEWDPSLLDVDFLAFHTYNPLRVKNEIYWYAKNANKPWMLGETGLSADNDTISYIDQKIFMNEALEQVLNCEGAGFGWWQFQDVEWGEYKHKYLGLLNHEGYTLTEDGDTILGSLKNKNIPYFTDVKKTGKCECGVNYYNMIGYENYLTKGVIVDENNNPIEGAVIRGWSKEWYGMNTFSAPDGSFTLYSNTPAVHFKISATAKSTVTRQLNLNYQPKADLNDLSIKNEFVEYQQISYQEFLKNDSKENSSPFNFDEKYFNNYKFQATIDTIRLSETELYP